LLRLVVALRYFWMTRSHHSEARDWLERALAAAPAADPLLRLKALGQAGGLARFQGDLDRAAARQAAALALARQLGDERHEGIQLIKVALVATDAGEYQRATALYEEGLRLLSRFGDAPEARWWIAAGLHSLADNTMKSGDLDRAADQFEEALARSRAVGDLWLQLDVLYHLGLVARHRGEFGRAGARFQEGLALAVRLGHTWFVAVGMWNVAAAIGAMGQPERAAHLLAASNALLQAHGHSLDTHDRNEFEQFVAAVQAALGDTLFAAVWADGQELPFDEAIAEALAPVPEPASVSVAGRAPAHSPTEPFALTRRELEVLRLLCERLTDPEIAERLCLSPRTASNHVASVLAKLGAANRREAAALAARRGLA
jgi:non-specific serine/threonine protein kinase